MKNARKETCEETLGRERKQHKAFLSLDTLKKTEARKKVKEVLNHGIKRAKKAEARIRYSDSTSTRKLNVASEPNEVTLWKTSRDRQRRHQAEAMQKSYIPSQGNWQAIERSETCQR